MKKRLRKKKQKSYFKKVNVEIIKIESLEHDFNFIITFKICETRCTYQVQIIKYMPAFKQLRYMQKDWQNRTLFKGLMDWHKKDLSLYLPKYKIKAFASELCFGHCVSNSFNT